MKNQFLLGEKVIVNGKKGEITEFFLEDGVPVYEIYFSTGKSDSFTGIEISMNEHVYRQHGYINNKFWIGEMVCITRVLDEEQEYLVGKVGKVNHIYLDAGVANYKLIDADGEIIAENIWEEELAQFTGIFPQSSTSKKRRRIQKNSESSSDDDDSE